MASLPSDCSQTGMGSDPSRKVRIVAKIRGVSDQEHKLSSGFSAPPWVSVQKPTGEASESVSISFADPSASRKESYQLDGFYGQNDSTNEIFSREVKPLISGVFDGCNATIIACGARGSGKSYLIQGSDEKPGLAAQAMAEILLMAEENGKSIAISFYEIYQDHVCDLLDPKRSAVSVLEDAQGKIQLKGLSEVPVKYISDFHKLYFGSRKATQKTATELTRRSHKGLIVYVSSSNENSDTSLVGKMNFVDLAGYEDARRKSVDPSNFVESTKINKSLYALQNVVFALNANESRVPYRESKLTRVLQYSLGVTNKILMVTCLNSTFCQDSMCMVKLASRSCQSKNLSVMDSTKKSKSVTKQVSRTQMFVKQSQISRSVSAAMNKKTASRTQVSEKHMIGAGSAMKARKLFDEATHSTKSKKVADHYKVDETTHSTKSKKAIDHSKVDEATQPTKFKKGIDHSKVDEATHSTKSKKAIEHSKVDVATQSTKSKKANLSLDRTSTKVSSVQEEEKFIPIVTNTTVPLGEGSSSTVTQNDVETTSVAEEESSLAVAQKDMEPTSVVEKDIYMQGEEEVDHEDAILGDTKDLPLIEDVSHEDATLGDTKDLPLIEDGANYIDKENKGSIANEGGSPPLSVRLRELSNNLKSLYLTPLSIKGPLENQFSSVDSVEPKTPILDYSMKANEKWDAADLKSPWETFSMRSSGMKDSLVQEFLRFLNTATKEELKGLKGIGEKRATYILELRAENIEPFQSLDDLKDIGLSGKQIKEMVRNVAVGIFN